MRILHYFLGFPPYRTGGLTRFACDLMETQSVNGNEVMAVWPGEMKILSKKTQFKKHKTRKNIQNYEMINPLPVSLDEGISNIDSFCKEFDPLCFEKFLKKVKPEVFHIHTLMGLPKEFVEKANELGIRTVFTTHDYFGICPKVTLFTGGNVCDNDFNCLLCEQCNKNALSNTKIILLQSPLYRLLKNSVIVRCLRKKHRMEYYDSSLVQIDKSFNNLEKSDSYIKLRNYYKNILEKVEIIHYNSYLTKKIFEKYIKPKSGKVITISHKNIRDNKKIFELRQGNIVRMAMLAPPTTIKGFDYLKSVLDRIWDSGNRNFTLKVYGYVAADKKSEYLQVVEEGFDNNCLEDVFKEVDIVVVPSIWYETFGFTVLEALSYGIPVIVTDRVGASCIVGDAGIIVRANDSNDLEKQIIELSVQKVKELKIKAQNNTCVKLWDDFVKEMYNIYECKDC